MDPREIAEEYLNKSKTTVLDLERLRNESRVSLYDNIAEPEVCLSINDCTIGSFGNFFALNGKAKSRKSFLCVAIVAAVISNKTILNLKGSFPKKRGKVFVIDTEQSKSQVKKCLDRMYRLSGLSKEEFSELVEVLSLRKFAPNERLNIIEHALINYEGLGLVIIDGVRDLIFDINNAEEAVTATSKLLKWSEELNILIGVVIHQNKGNTDSRGHLGTEINNKAESVISVTKDEKNKTVSIIEAEFMRDKEFESFGFSIDETGLPFSLDSLPEKPKISKKLDYLSIHISTHKEILLDVFKSNSHQKYSELIENIKIVFKLRYVDIGTNLAGEIKTFYEREKLILQDDFKKYRIHFNTQPL